MFVVTITKYVRVATANKTYERDCRTNEVATEFEMLDRIFWLTLKCWTRSFCSKKLVCHLFVCVQLYR